MDTEVIQDFDAARATPSRPTGQGHPHYEIMATGQVYDGDDEVMGYYRSTRTAFPDQRHENARFHISEDAVIVEFDLLGTNLGEFYGTATHRQGVPGADDRGVLLRGRTQSSTSASTSIPPAWSPQIGRRRTARHGRNAGG